MRTLRWLLFALGAFVVIGVIGNMIDPAGSRAVFAPKAEVLVTRDLNEMRFTNDGPDPLRDCDVTIEGNHTALLRELPVREQKFLVRAQFAPAVPDGEFFARALRSTKMDCASGPDGMTRARIRLK